MVVVFSNFFAVAAGIPFIWVQGSWNSTTSEWVADDGNPLPFMEPYEKSSKDPNILFFEEGTFHGLNSDYKRTHPFCCVI